FGCVLYEMLSGRSPFPGDSVAQTFAAILDHEPDWNNLPQSTPEAIRRLLRRCLEKEPKQRMHHLAGARIELDEVIPTLTTRAHVVPRDAKRNRRVLAGVSAMLPLMTLGAYVLLHNGAERLSTRPSDGTVVINERQITTNPIEDPIVFAAISP